MRTKVLFFALCVISSAALATSSGFDESTQKSRINVQLAEAYLEQGDLSTALDKANRAVRIDDKSGEAHAMLALVFDRMNRQEKAASSFARAVKLAPETGSVLNAVAVWHCQHGRYTEADTFFLRAMDDPLSKQHQQFLHNASECAFVGGDLVKAEAYYRQVLASQSADIRALEGLAMLHLRKGDGLRARAFLQRREAAGPATADMLELAAQIEDLAGASDAAKAYREKRAQQFPDAAAAIPLTPKL